MLSFPAVAHISTYSSILSSFTTYFSISGNPFVFNNEIAESYLNIPSNCAIGISNTESLIPKPVSISPVHPAIPIIVIIALFLYLNIFLAVTFCEKLNFLHIKGIFSNNILFPFLGDFGLINTAGISLNSFLATIIVAPPIQINEIIIPINPMLSLYVQ